ncbi:MAG: hypothetical protein MHMPM18_003635 [Marteilia pararefringens]
MVHLDTKTIENIYKGFFDDGVLVVSLYRGYNEKCEAPNWQIRAVARKLISNNLVDVRKSWSHEYYILNESGINHIRELLHLPKNMAPKMLAESMHSQQVQKSAPADKGDMNKAINVKEANLGAPVADHDFRGGFRLMK